MNQKNSDLPVAAAICGNCPHSSIDHEYVPPYACRKCSCPGFVNDMTLRETRTVTAFVELVDRVPAEHGELELELV